jgi:hypothetical protein
MVEFGLSHAPYQIMAVFLRSLRSLHPSPAQFSRYDSQGMEKKGQQKTKPFQVSESSPDAGLAKPAS